MARLIRTSARLDQDDVIDALVRGLCGYEVLNGRYLVQLPVVTAFGSTVSVSIYPEGGGDTFMVSDAGLAYHEVSSAMADHSTFVRVATARCRRFGAAFDGATMLIIRVSKDRLRGAVVGMADLVRQVIDETLEKSFAKQIDQSLEVFSRRVAEAFPHAKRTEQAEIIGQSTASYRVDMMVEVEGRRIGFEHFGDSPASISAAFLTLTDIGRLDDELTVVGVTPSLQAVGPKLTLLTKVARIVETEAPADAYRRAAAA
jgi:hypothetical protein